MFRPPVGGFGYDIARRFSQHIFLRGPPDFLRDRLRAHDFNNMIIQEWNQALDGMPHFHAISQKHQKVVGQPGFRPEIKRLIQWLSPSELAGDINIIEEAAESVMPRIAIEELPAQHRVHLRG